MTGNPWRFGLLHPAPRNDRERIGNDALLGPSTLGIEVTIPHYAARCGLGNIDPQHDGGTDPRAAIEVCLDRAPPPAGTTLVTIRPDVDAFGSMALLALRAAGAPLSTALRTRVAAAAAQDKFARGPWPGPRPLPREAKDFLALQAGGATLAVLAACVTDHAGSLPDRIDACARWLLTGQEPERYRGVVTSRAEALSRAFRPELIRVESRPSGNLAFIQSAAEGAIQLGYLQAPVVIGLHPRFRFAGGPPHRKFTVCQYQKGHADLYAAAAALNELEPGWGGSATIIGSPQGRGSALRPNDVIDIVARHLTPRGGTLTEGSPADRQI